MINLELEKEFISRFVKKERRDRLLEFATKTDDRNRLLNELNSPAVFDSRYVVEIEGKDRTQDRLPEIYKEHGMGGRVYAISQNDEWDGNKFQMSYIVNECMAMCIDTIGYCWKTKIAFYEWHHSGASYLLKK